MKYGLLAGGLLFAAASLASAANAAVTFFSNTTGLVAPISTITFDEVLLATNDTVTNEFAPYGASFGNAFYRPQDGFFVGGYLGNFNNDTSFQGSDFTILFTSVQDAAAFQYITNSGTSTIEAYLGATLVGSASLFTTIDTTLYFGFTGGSFDSIRLVAPGNLALEIDNLQLGSGAVPEPASWAMLIAGFGLVGAAARRRRTAVAA